MRRRNLSLAALAAAVLPGAAAWGADAYPQKPLRLIVGFASGGGADALTRIIAEGLSKQLGQQVIVENRPGADGVLAAQATSSARPDGYTLLMGTNTAMVAAPTLRPTPPYDPFKAFTPISSAGQFSMFLVVPSSLPAKSVSELLAMVAAKPGTYNSASSNSASELAMLSTLSEVDGAVADAGHAASAVSAVVAPVDGGDEIVLRVCLYAAGTVTATAPFATIDKRVDLSADLSAEMDELCDALAGLGFASLAIADGFDADGKAQGAAPFTPAD